MISEKKIFGFAAIFRVLTALVMSTWFVPDEIFQSVEVAYKLEYGKGHLSWEWQPENALRSSLHPIFITFFYFNLRKWDLDSNWAIVYVPKILHALIFALGDVFLYKLAKRVLNAHEKSIYWAMFVHFTNWFTIYCAPRTLSNSLETALTLIALHWYPLDGPRHHHRSTWPYVFLSTLTIFLRPTAVLIWGPLMLLHMHRGMGEIAERYRGVTTAFVEIVVWKFRAFFLPTIAAIAITLYFDMAFYDNPAGIKTFPILNFAIFNVFSGGSAHFGSHPWWWYFILGLPPLLLVTAYPFYKGVHDIGSGSAHRGPPPTMIFWNIFIFYIVFHSFLAHKEHRFLLPLLPFVALYAGHYLGHVQREDYQKFWKYSILQGHVIAAVYFCFVHQRGPYAAHNAIYSDLTQRLQDSNLTKNFEILQLMPCYSMPQYAHFHPYPVTIHMLDCSPNLKRLKDYEDESEQFHGFPKTWLKNNIEKVLDSDYIMIYQNTYEKISKILKTEGFYIWKKLVHTVVVMSDNEDTYLYVLKKS